MYQRYGLCDKGFVAQLWLMCQLRTASPQGVHKLLILKFESGPLYGHHNEHI